MCGLIGYIAPPAVVGTDLRAKFFKQGLIVDTLRGDDSTGIFTVPWDNAAPKAVPYEFDTAYYYKRLGDGYSMVSCDGYQTNIVPELIGAKYVVGHNRAATKGAVTVDNAHPFQEGPITLVHNGTLLTTHTLPKSQYDLNVTVDSHAICHNLAIAGVEVAEVKNVIESIDGAFALIWHDARDDSLNIVRNSERTLFLCEDKQGGIYFSSELAMLHLLITRLKIPLTSDGYRDLSAGTFLKFRGNKLVHTSKMEVEYSAIDYYNTTWRSYGGYVPKKPSVKSEKTGEYNHVLIDGRMQEVPDWCQDRLLDLDMTPADRLQFTYEMDQVNERHVVHGMIGGLGYKAVLTGTSLHMPKSAAPITVRPVAVNKVGDNDYIVLVRVYALLWSEDMYYQELNYDTKPPFEEAEDNVVIGYNGKVLSKAEWELSTSYGCCCCAKVPTEMHAALDWYDHDTFICEECSATSYGGCS